MNVKPNVSLPLGKKSRNANTLESNTIRGSTLSKTPLSSNSLAIHRDNTIHRQLWVLKAHDGKSQASKGFYVEGLNHNLFSVGQLCDVDLEVAFWKSTCYIRDLKGNDLLTGIEHLTSTARTPEQNDVVKKWNRTLVEAARTMLSTTKVPLFFWDEAIDNMFYSKPDGENLDKMKEKGDACIFVGYCTQSRAYRVYNKRTRVIVETIHVNFDELPQMASDHVSSDPIPQCPTTVFEQTNLSPDPKIQQNVAQAAKIVTTLNKLDLLFSLMFDELLNETTPLVSKSFTVTAADTPDQRQQHNTTPSTSITVAANTPPLNIQTTPVITSQTPTQAPTVTTTENINQAETQKENA
nr:hypothetical protein [Tanacetum cinerariifolium]